MDEPCKGRQTPTQSVVLPYTQTHGQESIDLYNSTGRTAQEWQEIQLYGKHAVYELCIPKGDSHDREDKTVEFFGQKWRTFGFPLKWI